MSSTAVAKTAGSPLAQLLRRVLGSGLLVVALALAASRLVGKKKRAKNLPPEVRTYCFGFDNLIRGLRVYDHYIDMFTEWKREYGNTFCVNMLGKRLVLVFEPTSVQHFLAKNFDNYEKSPGFRDLFEPMLGTGIFNSNGDIWRHHRTTARPHFAKVELNKMVPCFDKHAAILMDRLDLACKRTEEIDLQQLFFSFTLDSVGEILFGYNIDSLNKPSPFQRAFDYVQDSMAFRSAMDPLWRIAELVRGTRGDFERNLRIVNAFVDGIIDSAEKDPNFDARDDLLAEYMREGHPREYLHAMLRNMLIAGRDTTAVLLSHLFFELSSRPDVEENILAELEAVVGDRTSKPSGEHLPKLKYLKSVINETLRLHPSVPFDFRSARQDDTLPNGYDIPAGADVAYMPVVYQRMPEWWGDDADKFDPDRWTADRIRKVPPFAFAPFLAGPRICLGQNMAYTEAKLAAVSILQKYKIRVNKSRDLDYRATIILSFRKGLWVTVEKRE